MDETLKVIIQLVILCIPLITLPLILKTSSSILGRVNGMAERFNSKTLESGLGRGKSGLKNAGLGAEARMARMGNEQNAGRFAKAAGRAGSYRGRRQNKKDVREALRKSNVDEAVTKFYDTGDTDLDARRARKLAGFAAGEGNRDMVNAQLKSRANELFGQKIKLEEAKLSGKTTKDLENALSSALSSGNAAAAYAATSSLTQKGGAGAESAAKMLHGAADGENFNSEAAKLAASVVRSNGKDLNATDPSLTKWAEQDTSPNSPPPKSLGQVAADAGTYAGSSAEKMATWNTGTITNAWTAAQSAGTTNQLKEQSRQLLESRHADTLSPEARQLHERIINSP